VPKRSLPENPALENLKKQAKRLQKAVRAADAESLALVREFHPRANEAITDCSLSDAQLVKAREYGFSSWPKLKKHLEVVERFAWNPPAGPPTEASGSRADAFVRLPPRLRLERAEQRGKDAPREGAGAP